MKAHSYALKECTDFPSKIKKSKNIQELKKSACSVGIVVMGRKHTAEEGQGGQT